MSRIALLLSLISFIISCSSSPTIDIDDDDDIEVDTLQKYPNDGEMKIMSFNIRCVKNEETPSNNWDFRKASCVEMVKDQRPTIIGVQEAVYSSQWNYLKEELSNEYDGFGVGRDDGVAKGECEGILFLKDQIQKIDGGTFWLSKDPDNPSKGWGSKYYRAATWGEFEIKESGQRLVFINTHLDLTDDIRTEEMKVIVQRFSELNPDGYAQFLTGDFNASSNDAIFNKLKDTMYSARENTPTTDYSNTFNGWGDGSGIIDHIFYCGDISCVEYHTITESYGSVTYLSDHYPIYAIIKL